MALALKYAGSFKKDPEVVMAAVLENSRALQFADELVNKGGDDAKKVVMAAVRKYGRVFIYAGPFKEDPEVVTAAV